MKNLTLHTLQLLCFHMTVWTIRPIALYSYCAFRRLYEQSDLSHSAASELSDNCLNTPTYHTLQPVSFQTTVWTLRPVTLCSSWAFGQSNPSVPAQEACSTHLAAWGSRWACRTWRDAAPCCCARAPFPHPARRAGPSLRGPACLTASQPQTVHFKKGVHHVMLLPVMTGTWQRHNHKQFTLRRGYTT